MKKIIKIIRPNRRFLFYKFVILKNMTKEGLTDAVLKAAKCDTKKQAQEAVDAVFASITKSLSRGEEVTVTGFGTFRTMKAAARSGRNPKTGESLRIPASIKPKFKAGKALKEAVR